MRATLEGVKPGDTIKVGEDYGRGFTLHTVIRTTATLAVCEKASFKIASGTQMGTRTTGRWSTSKYGELVADADVPALKAQLDIKRRVVDAHYRMQRLSVTADNLEAAEAFIAASQKKEPTNAA
jgi:hypothetical protein